MRGSSVAFAFKSWASKLHPQLPLDSKESHKLLSAITHSFRKHLDEAHPPPQDESGLRPKALAASPSKPGAQQAQPSSANLADRHLASLFSNPAFASSKASRGTGPAHSSAATSSIYHGSDPILFLEQHDNQGTATLEIARSGLHAFQKSLENLSSDRVKARILKTRAGARTLGWLWKRNLLESDALAETPDFLRNIVSLVVQEGREHLLWTWLDTGALSTSLRDPNITSDNGQHFRNDAPNRAGKVQSLLVHELVRAKLNLEATDMGTALDTFFKACEMMGVSQTSEPQPRTVHLKPAGQMLSAVLRKRPSRRATVDVERYEKFIASVPLWYGRSQTQVRLSQSLLWLSHPKSPDPYPALDVLEAMFQSNTSGGAKILFDKFTRPKSEQHAKGCLDMLLRTAQLLQTRSDFDRASWVMGKARRYFSHLADLDQVDLQKTDRPLASLSEEFDPPLASIPSPAFG